MPRADHGSPSDPTEQPAPTRSPPALWALTGALALLLAVLGAIALLRGPSDSSGDRTASGGAGTKAAATPPELPRGGRRLLPDRRVVSFAGAPQDPELGELGVGSLRGAVAKLDRQSRSYARKTRPVQPALQLISTVAHSDPGRNGRYSLRQSSSTIARYLREARRAKNLLILDIQPGRSSFLTETKRLERWLREPDVALALDPEWRLEKAGQVPGQTIGSVSAKELQQSLDEVARIVHEYDLPPKLVMVHRFTENMIRGLSTVRIPPGVQPVMSIDGVGDRANKVAKYRQFTRDLPRGWRPGFKVFFHEDEEAGGLMTPAQVMDLRPRPQVVLYE